LHRLQQIHIYKLSVAGIQWAMQGYNIRLTETGGKVNKGYSVHFIPFRVVVICNHFHSESKCNTRYASSYLSQPYNTQCKLIQFDQCRFPITKVLTCTPLPCPYTVCM